MSFETKIEWTDRTWNPWEGCTKVSLGCANCYAEARNKRFFAGANWGKGKPRRRTSASNWKLPLKWNREAAGFGVCITDKDGANPRWMSDTNNGVEIWAGTQSEAEAAVVKRTSFYPNLRYAVRPAPRLRVFPSLCDWLDDEVPIEWLADFLKLIHETPNLDWLLLTKRPENWQSRMEAARATEDAWINESLVQDGIAMDWLNGFAPPNVWLGVSIEDQQRGNERIPELLKIPAAVRFLSVEPLLGPVDFPHAAPCGYYCDHDDAGGGHRPGHGLSGIDWVIVGGESGPGARPCNIEWIRGIVRQCKIAGVPCFVKQLGSRPYGAKDGCYDDYGWRKRITHRKGGDPSEWPEDLRVREFPKVGVGEVA